MGTLIAIMTHGDKAANDTLLRHLPMWEALGHDLLVASPSDNPARLPDNHLEQCHPGKQWHDGLIAMHRQKNLMREMSRRSAYDWHLIAEYDVVFLGDRLPEFAPGASGLLNPNFDLRRFKSPWAMGPPWVMDRDSLKRILAYADAHPETIEEGCIDRFLPAWAMGAGVPVLPLPKSGLFLNDITPADYPRMVQICKSGGCFYHGIKTEECLNVLLKAWKSQ